jgi:hypothetical protein
LARFAANVGAVNDSVQRQSALAKTAGLRLVHP